MKVFQAIPELLRRHGTGVVFSMLGSTNAPWLAHGVSEGVIRLVKTRHEETAVHAATGYGRVTGSMGVATVTRGPGFANSVNALISAKLTHSPLLLIVHESPTENAPGKYTEQNIDQAGLARVIGAGFHHAAKADHLEAEFWSAVRDGYWNGCPQILSLGQGLLTQEITLDANWPESMRPNAQPSPEAVNAAVDALERSRRPLVLAGQGAVLADCRPELEELATLVGARLATTLPANRFFSSNPHDVGVCGSWAAPVMRDCLAQTDVVLAVGASLNQKTTDHGWIFGGATVIQCEIDSDRPFRASAPQLALIGDAKVTARALSTEWRARGLAARPVEGTTPTYKEAQESVLSVDLFHDPARGLDTRRVYAAVDAVLPADRIVVTDSGRSLATQTALVNAQDARSWVLGRGYGSVGMGLGFAIGAAAAEPDRHTVLLCGDGGFMMGLSGLDAIRMNGLNLSVVIINDEQLGSEVTALAEFGLPLDVVRQSLPDIPTLAAGFGGRGATISTESELAALRLDPSGLEVIDARVDPEMNVRATFG